MTNNSPKWLRSVELAVERDEGVVLNVDHETYRVRLLAVETEALIVEHPRKPGSVPRLLEHQQVDLMLPRSTERWSLRCAVADRLKFTLDGNPTLALRLSWPMAINSQQRRSHFRVNTAGADRPTLRIRALHELASATPCENELQQLWRNRKTIDLENLKLPEPACGPEIAALAVDLSGGGMSIVTQPEAEALLATDPLLWIELQLPGEELPLLAVAKIAHWQRIRGSTRPLIRAGLAFVYDHNPAHSRFMTDQLCRAATELQRLQLQRNREA